MFEPFREFRSRSPSDLRSLRTVDLNICGSGEPRESDGRRAKPGEGWRRVRARSLLRFVGEDTWVLKWPLAHVDKDFRTRGQELSEGLLSVSSTNGPSDLS